MILPDKASRFRLRSSAFERNEEKEQADPKRVVFLSVEGDETEKNYFEHYQSFIGSSGNDQIIRIEVLRRKKGTGYSSPEYVLELLNEYIALRHGELLPKELPQSFTDKYSKEEVKQYLEKPNSIPKAKLKMFYEELLKVGIDIKYRQYLKDFNNEGDYFAIVLDKDSKCHSKELLNECIAKCEANGYGCYITNPCFEFWLLLHLCDIKAEYSDDLDKLLLNDYVSDEHTYISQEIMRLARHKKHISKNMFMSKYLPNIPRAIECSKDFACDLKSILDNLGSNLPDLISIIGYKGR